MEAERAATIWLRIYLSPFTWLDSFSRNKPEHSPRGCDRQKILPPSRPSKRWVAGWPTVAMSNLVTAVGRQPFYRSAAWNDDVAGAVLRPRAGIARGATLPACCPGLRQWHHHFDERTVVVMVVHVRRGQDENHRRQPMSALDPYPGLSPIPPTPLTTAAGTIHERRGARVCLVRHWRRSDSLTAFTEFVSKAACKRDR